MSSYEKTALSWFGLKDAMLYFPHVIPLGAGFDLLFERIRSRTSALALVESGIVERLGEAIEADLVPPELRNKAFINDLNSVTKAGVPFLMEHMKSALENDYEAEPEAKTNFVEAARSFFTRYHQLRSLPLVVDPEFMSDGTNQGDDISITISSLKLIDTSATGWDQIIEFRKDREAMEKLRRFRVFAYQSYAGKSHAFVEDDILTRIYDYELAVKKCGFATTSAALTTIMDSKLIAGGIAGSFISAYMQSPIAAVVSAASAAGLAIGKIAIELRKQDLAKQELMVNHPVSYISYGKEKLEFSK
jgi:hypothetical protein